MYITRLPPREPQQQPRCLPPCRVSAPAQEVVGGMARGGLKLVLKKQINGKLSDEDMFGFFEDMFSPVFKYL